MNLAFATRDDGAPEARETAATPKQITSMPTIVPKDICSPKYIAPSVTAIGDLRKQNWIRRDLAASGELSVAAKSDAGTNEGEIKAS